LEGFCARKTLGIDSSIREAKSETPIRRADEILLLSRFLDCVTAFPWIF
jgi:hypothetical protein